MSHFLSWVRRAGLVQCNLTLSKVPNPFRMSSQVCNLINAYIWAASNANKQLGEEVMTS